MPIKVIILAYQFASILLLSLPCDAFVVSEVSIDEKYFSDNDIDRSIKKRFEQHPAGSSETSHRIREEQLRLDFLKSFLYSNVNKTVNHLESIGFECLKSDDVPTAEYRCLYRKEWIAKIILNPLIGPKETVRVDHARYLFVYHIYSEDNKLIDARCHYKLLEISHLP